MHTFKNHDITIEYLVSSYSHSALIWSMKDSGEKIIGLYELNLLPFMNNKFDFQQQKALSLKIRSLKEFSFSSSSQKYPR